MEGQGGRPEPKELRSGDKVQIVGVKAPMDFLNGKVGFLQPTFTKKEWEESNRELDRGLAVLEGNKYRVLIEMGGGEGEKTYRVKRKNLKLLEGSIGTMLDMDSLKMSSEELSGSKEKVFYALTKSNGDPQRVREAMEDIARERNPSLRYSLSVADNFFDLSGSTPLVNAIILGQKEAVQILLEYGADVDAPVGPGNPRWRSLELSPLLLSLFQISTASGDNPAKKIEREEIVFLLIEAGADVNRISKEKGSALLMATSKFIPPKKWEFRMKLLEALLEKGAVPCTCHCRDDNTIISPLSLACMVGFFGSEDDRIRAVQLLLNHGADPGALTSWSEGLECTTLHEVAVSRLWGILEVLLQSEKGRAAVNRHDGIGGVPPVSGLVHASKEIESKSRNDVRKCFAILLRYGADLYIRTAAGPSTYDYLSYMNTPKAKELLRLVRKAPPPQKKDAVFAYWSSPEVETWIGENMGPDMRCSARLFCPGMPGAKAKSDFQVCARCGKQWYCSQECQKCHWPYHKLECVPKKNKKK